MSTHSAVVTVAPRAPLELHQIPTPSPSTNQVLIRQLWTASTPLDLHQADGHLLVTPPQTLGDGIGGQIVALGPDANTNALPATSDLQVGDLVFGFAWRTREEKAYQTLVLAERWQVGKVPDGWGANRLQELVTIPNNFVTGWHTLVTDLNLPLPWPKPQGYHPASSEAKRILIWGGSSSVGQFTLQILRYYGYDSVVATASSRNLDLVKKAGAKEVVDYRSPGWQQDVTRALGGDVELVLDCIGSLDGSVRPIATLVGEGAVVAVLLPVVVKDAGEKGGPVYAMSATENVEWKAGVEVKGVRTHFYADHDFHKQYLQPVIMPTLVQRGVIVPNRQKIVQAPMLLERAEKALGILRRKEVSGERVVFKLAEEEDHP